MVTLLNATETDEAYRAVPYVPYGQPGHVEYSEAQNAIEGQFRAFLHETYLEGYPEDVADIVYAHAYSEGHSSGFQEIENYYGEISITVTRVVDILNRG